MSETANLLGVPADFEFGGKVFKITPRTLETEALFEVWLESQALDAIERHAPDFRNPGQSAPGRLTPAAYHLLLSAFSRDCATQIYAWDGPAATMALISEPGQKELTYLQLLQENPNLTRKVMEAVWKDPEARARLQTLRARADAVPNPQAPGEGESPSA